MKIVKVPHTHRELRHLHRVCFPLDAQPEWEIGHWWLIMKDSSPAAFAGIQPSCQWLDTMYMVRAGVAPAYQGQGLQKRLIRIRERFARKQGMNWLITSTYANMRSANNLISCGFRIFEPTLEWGAEGTIYWSKQL